jgi:hypothetical protein
MKHLLFLCLALPFWGHAQKIAHDIEPDSHTGWWVTNDVDLNHKVITSNHCIVHFRVAGTRVFLYVSDNGEAINASDYMTLITDKDTVVAHSTGPQRGYTANASGVTYHEYELGMNDLGKLAAGPVQQVVISHYSGFQRLTVGADGNNLKAAAAALVKAVQTP